MNECLFGRNRWGGGRRARGGVGIYHFLYVSCFISRLLLGCWKHSFKTFIIERDALREMKRWCKAWHELWQVQPWKVYHVFHFTSRERREEIICRNRFNFKFIFLSPFIAMCIILILILSLSFFRRWCVFSPPSHFSLLFHLCSEAKVFYHKSELTALFICFLKAFFQFVLSPATQKCCMKCRLTTPRGETKSAMKKKKTLSGIKVPTARLFLVWIMLSDVLGHRMEKLEIK